MALDASCAFSFILNVWYQSSVIKRFLLHLKGICLRRITVFNFVMWFLVLLKEFFVKSFSFCARIFRLWNFWLLLLLLNQHRFVLHPAVHAYTFLKFDYPQQEDFRQTKELGRFLDGWRKGYKSLCCVMAPTDDRRVALLNQQFTKAKIFWYWRRFKNW